MRRGMTSELYWIPGTWPGRLAIMPRPRGGDWLEDEVRGWRSAGVETVVSLLEPEEIAEFDLAAEEQLARANAIEFRSLPIVDRGVPASAAAVSNLVNAIAEQLRGGKAVAIHCRQGIGRAAVVAAGVLVALGLEADAAMERIASARGRPVPETPEQRRWIVDFARTHPNPLPL
jgi:protein-tyrosine phosphatase